MWHVARAGTACCCVRAVWHQTSAMVEINDKDVYIVGSVRSPIGRGVWRKGGGDNNKRGENERERGTA